jgi:hypothetical protein
VAIRFNNIGLLPPASFDDLLPRVDIARSLEAAIAQARANIHIAIPSNTFLYPNCPHLILSLLTPCIFIHPHKHSEQSNYPFLGSSING